MKLYSELLFAWGFPMHSIQLCKVITRAEYLLIKYQKHLYPQIKIPKDHFHLKDYLLFSERSLGYRCE